jgi:cyclic pyranopterin phosphate synthase
MAMADIQQTVTDTRGRPIHDLRISVTDRCNFRCTYCMPAEIFGERYTFLRRDQVLSYEEITRVTRIFVRLGVRKVRVTGGEPLVRQDLPELIAQLSPIEGIDDLTLTTNGTLLAAQAAALKGAGLERITVSLDSVDPDVFATMNGRGAAPDAVLEGIDAAERVGLTPIKINAVVERGVNEHTVVDLARRFKGTGHILRFIEFMDVGNLNSWKADRVVPSAELVELIGREMPIEVLEPNYVGEVAQRWRYLDGDGEIGFISSVTQPFCGSCTRARLSPEGKIFTCLFATDGLDILTPLRQGATDEELLALIEGLWRARTDRYSDLRAAAKATPARKVEMYQIGG